VFEPDNRSLLLTALRPPLGYRFDYGIATTYTLDFLSALSAPLALAGYWVADNLETNQVDQVSICDALDAVRSRLDIFVQTGNIETRAASKAPSPLVALLEPMIHEVKRPRPGRLFHPKLWLLRFVHDSEAPSYRCLVLSRNLTQDRSWDLLLTLESDSDARTKNPNNDHLVRLVESLPDRTTIPLMPNQVDRIQQFAQELTSVTWESLEGFDDVMFYAFGVPGLRSSKPQSLFRGYNHLIISPFASSSALEAILENAKGSVQLVTRAETASQLTPEIHSRVKTFVLDVNATLDTVEEEVSGNANALRVFDDVHAKAYLVESGQSAFLYVGSANATDAAFSGNTEILAELRGSKNLHGVDAVFGEHSMFRNVVVPWSFSADDKTESDDGTLERQMQSYLVDLAAVGFEIDASQSGDIWACRVRSRSAIPALPAPLEQCIVNIGPVFSNHEGHRLKVGGRADVAFAACGLDEISAFMRLTIAESAAPDAVRISTCVRGELRGVPVSRSQDVIIRLLDTPEKLLRFIQLLLAIGQREALDASLDFVTSSGEGGGWASTEHGMFEALIEAVARDRESLSRLAPIIERIIETGDKHHVLPEGWRELWMAVSQARNHLESLG
jgi:hypothetical protein